MIELLACSVCYGDPDSAMSKGAIAGVLVLLGVILGVLGWIGGFAIYFVRRARSLETEAGPKVIPDPFE